MQFTILKSSLPFGKKKGGLLKSRLGREQEKDGRKALEVSTIVSQHRNKIC